MRLLLAFVLLCVPVIGSGRSFDDDLAALIDNALLPRVSEQKNAGPPTGSVTRDFSVSRLVLVSSITFYQRAISSQDMSVCNYFPSCSRFGEQAISKAGVLRGLLLTSDRLQRCNGFAGYSRAYRYDPVRQKFLDPLERYTEVRRACFKDR
jgi:putative component of membrane protein insertase Oxa1/YidC/SpoIIIJ protein YidD